MVSREASRLLEMAGKSLATNDGAVVIYRGKKRAKVDGFETFKANWCRNPIWTVALLVSCLGVYAAIVIVMLVKDLIDDLIPDFGADDALGLVSGTTPAGGVALSAGGPIGWALKMALDAKNNKGNINLPGFDPRGLLPGSPIMP